MSRRQGGSFVLNRQGVQLFSTLVLCCSLGKYCQGMAVVLQPDTRSALALLLQLMRTVAAAVLGPPDNAQPASSQHSPEYFIRTWVYLSAALL